MVISETCNFIKLIFNHFLALLILVLHHPNKSVDVLIVQVFNVIQEGSWQNARNLIEGKERSNCGEKLHSWQHSLGEDSPTGCSQAYLEVRLACKRKHKYKFSNNYF